MRGGIHRSFLGLAVALLALALPVPASAAIRYASPTGSGPSGAGGCTQGNPCSLDAAIEDASVVNGDEIIVLPGTYTNLVGDSILVNDAIDIHGQAGSARPVIQENAAATTMLITNQATVTDLEIENANVGGATLASIAEIVPVVLRRVVITAASNSASACSLLFATVTDSVCRNTSSGPAAGFSGDFDADVTMRNVTLWSNTGQGVFIEAGGSNTDIDWDLKNVVAHGGSGIDVVASRLLGTGSIDISLAYSNYASTSVSGGATATNPNTNNNQTAPPAFVNAATGDFHQLVTSPTLDAGVSDVLGTTDLDGDPRVSDDDCNSSSVPDIGVDEMFRSCNDDFAQAQVLTGSSATVDGRTKYATEESEPNYCTEDICGNNPTVTHSVWYRWTSPGTGPATVDLCSANNFDTMLAVFTGNSLGALTLVDANNNSADCPPGSFASKVSFGATQGATYQILVDGCCGLPAGTFTLTLNGPQAPPDPGGGGGGEGGGDTPDTTPPDTTITEGPSGKSKSRSATFAFTGSDAGAVASFQCKLDLDQFEACTSPKSHSRLKKGLHTFSVRAVDAAGNVDPTPATRTWKVKKKKKKKT